MKNNQKHSRISIAVAIYAAAAAVCAPTLNWKNRPPNTPLVVDLVGGAICVGVAPALYAAKYTIDGVRSVAAVFNKKSRSPDRFNNPSPT